MKLYGTTTSPYVRRVRVVAAELGVAVERVDTAPEAGQALLRDVSPIRKVPVAILAGETIFDSREIVARLTAAGWGPLAPPAPGDANLVNAIDAWLDSTIQLFYLRRDGVAIDGTPYAERQLARAHAIVDWLAARVAPHGRTFRAGDPDRLGFAEISAICALDWMDFRATYPTERAGALLEVRRAWRERASLRETTPHT